MRWETAELFLPPPLPRNGMRWETAELIYVCIKFPTFYAVYTLWFSFFCGAKEIYSFNQFRFEASPSISVSPSITQVSNLS